MNNNERTGSTLCGVRRLLVWVLGLAMIITMMPSAAFAASVSSAADLSGHWAKSIISSWQDAGRIKGYPDGTFRPDSFVTRAEFITLLNQTTGSSSAATVSFSDVSTDDWFHDAVATAVAGGYAAGFADGTFQPDATVTRAQAASFIARATGRTGGSAAGFTDAAAVPSWAADSVAAVTGAGYMSGYPDGSFGPDRNLTRAEAVTTLNRILGDSKTPVSDKDITISEAGTVSDKTVEGDVTIAESVGDGTVVLDGMTIGDDLIINGGSSVDIMDTTVGGVIIINKAGVHVRLQGKSNVGEINAEVSCKISGERFTGKTGYVNVPAGLTNKPVVTVGLRDSNVSLDSPATLKAEVSLAEINVAAAADGSTINVPSGKTVTEIIADGKITLTGSGTITMLNANAGGITYNYSLRIDKIRTASGVSKPAKVS